MRVRCRKVVLAVALAFAAQVGAAGVGANAVTVRSCRRVVIEGEVRAGEGFERLIGEGLKVWLEPVASGWVLRVLPVSGPRGAHDYAELATPPYRSVNPLLVSTDFSFRAQDVVGWNPRRFRFAVGAAEFGRLAEAYAASERAGAGQGTAQAETKLAELAGRAQQGELEILDARLVPGTADQAGAAAMVSSHFATTAHSLEPGPAGKGSPLGRVTWLRFRIRLEIPPGFGVAHGQRVEAEVCG